MPPVPEPSTFALLGLAGLALLLVLTKPDRSPELGEPVGGGGDSTGGRPAISGSTM